MKLNLNTIMSILSSIILMIAGWVFLNQQALAQKVDGIQTVSASDHQLIVDIQARTQRIENTLDNLVARGKSIQ